MQPVYVTASAQCLPGAPVGNDEMADFIGRLSPEAERLGRLTLRQNRIRHRHYAIRPDGSSDWTVARLAGAAVRNLLDTAAIDADQIGFLATATTQNDLLVPGLASLTHAEAGLPPMEVASLQSVCASSMMALKTAALQVAADEHPAAIAVGAEFSSRYFRPDKYLGTDVMRADGTLPADAEFLRWTLSDGAAGLLIEKAPAPRGLSLRIDWISLRSFADRFAPCMTGGAVHDGNGAISPWSMNGDIGAAAKAGAFQLRQDVAALYRMLPVWLGEFMRLVDLGRIDPRAVDWFLCHFSAHSLREEMTQLATRAGCMIPAERWFTNIYDKGNVGAAAIFLMIDDLLRSGQLIHGQKILLAVPESGQCIISYAGLTVVEAGQ
ncbi:3-oxoacyl-[acyl-carrier-protein] synthase III C-terminal domain-containing protein [Roseiarcaceae bacterium H3SJ34-1]|uniref:3-oxoacyl-[acyl-carrier-protein] synthase III C-terminal domain-containing protein n=1 Tax=Terripilifer ovatus TaxID=3032367 RepID=UPI003AB95363|nr:3-oxoacyl-[acyl-carrier-protein] synthase III C-terminal domain-containing protein [Roseiarcaceae bacterium H3SJ34-1]